MSVSKKEVRDFRVRASIDAFYTGGSCQVAYICLSCRVLIEIKIFYKQSFYHMIIVFAKKICFVNVFFVTL